VSWFVVVLVPRTCICHAAALVMVESFVCPPTYIKLSKH